MAKKNGTNGKEQMRIGLTEARAQLGELVDRVRYLGTPIILEKSGKPVAAIVSMEDMGKLPETTIPNQQRERAFDGIRSFQEQAAVALADLDESEIDELIAEAIREARKNTEDSAAL